jgi:hypothetical protein
LNGPVLGDRHTLGGALDGLPIPASTLSDGSYLWYRDFDRASDYDSSNDWGETNIGAGATVGIAVGAAGPGGGALVIAPGGANQGAILQPTSAAPYGEPATVGSVTACGARFALADADVVDCFVGLADLPAASVLTSAGALTADNHAGFHVTDALAGVFNFSAAGTADGTALTEAGVFTAANATYVDVAVRIVGPNRVTGYLRVDTADWRQVASITTTNDFNDLVWPTIAHVGDAAGETMAVDYIWMSRTR